MTYQIVQHEILECHDESHGHANPIQDMYGVIYEGHHIGITQDDVQYHVRIDGDPSTERWDLTAEEAIAYVERCVHGDGSFFLPEG